MKKLIPAWLVAGPLLALAGTVQAQLPATSAPVVVRYSGTAAPTLTVAATPATVPPVTLTPDGITPLPADINITTTWKLAVGSTWAVRLYGYFDPSGALWNATRTHALPAGWVEGSMNGPTGSYLAFTGAGPEAGTSLLLSYILTDATGRGSNVGVLNLRFNMTGRTLPPDTYRGTLFLRADVL